MGLDTSSQSDNSGVQSDSLIKTAASDLQAGQLNNQAFSDAVRAIYTRDQGKSDQLNTDLVALSMALQNSDILPNLVIIGEDAQGNIAYDSLATNQISLVDTNNNQVASAPGADQSSGGSQAPGADQNPGGSQAPGADQNPGGSQAPGADQNPGGSQAPGADQNPGTDQSNSAPAPGDSGQIETWGQNGRKYTPGENGEYTHVVEQFQGDDKPGDTMDRIATDSLDEQHANDPKYQPSEQEVTAEVERIAAYNKDDGTIGQPPQYMIKVGDTIKIPPEGWTPSASGDSSQPSANDHQGAGDPQGGNPDSGTGGQGSGNPDSGTGGQQSDNPNPGTGGQGSGNPDSGAGGQQSDNPSSGTGGQGSGNPDSSASDQQSDNPNPGTGGSPAANNSPDANDSYASNDTPPQNYSTPTVPEVPAQDAPAGGSTPNDGSGYQLGGGDPGSGPSGGYPAPGPDMPAPDNQSSQVYQPPSSYPDSGTSSSGAAPYGYDQPGGYGSQQMDPGSGPSGDAQPYNYPPQPAEIPPPAYPSNYGNTPSYGYPQGPYEEPPYEYPPAPYVMAPPVQTEIYVNPVGLVRDIGRLFGRR